MPKKRKIPTYAELTADTYYGDGPLLRLLLSPEVDYLGNIVKVFAKYDIERSAAGELELSIMTLISEAFREPEERSNISKAEVARPKKIIAAFLERTELVLEDPHFMEFMDFDQQKIQDKLENLRQQAAVLKGSSAGDRKLIKSHIPTVRMYLHKKGLGTNQQVEFLLDLFKNFKAPVLWDDRTAARAKIYDWFEDTILEYDSLISNSDP